MKNWQKTSAVQVLHPCSECTTFLHIALVRLPRQRTSLLQNAPEGYFRIRTLVFHDWNQKSVAILPTWSMKWSVFPHENFCSPAFRPCLPSLQSRYGSDSDTPSVQLIEPLHGHPLGRKSTNPRYDSSHPSPITTILFPLRRVTGVFAGEVPGCLPLMCVMICLWVPPQQDLCSNSFRSSHSLNTVLYKHNRNQSLAKKQIKWPMYISSNTLDDPFLVGGEINCTLQERMFLVHLGYCVI